MNPGDNHAAAMDAAAYWKNFTVRWAPAEAGDTVIGTVIDLGEVKDRDGLWVPRVTVELDDGDKVYVVAYQERLLAQLKRLAPKVGDRIKVRFLGIDPGPRGAHNYEVRVRAAVTDGSA